LNIEKQIAVGFALTPCAMLFALCATVNDEQPKISPGACPERSRRLALTLQRVELSALRSRNLPHFHLHFLCSPKENEAKEKAPSTWPAAPLAQRLPAAVPQTRPDKSGLRQCVTFIRIEPLRSAALNGIK
jgi:hypothetical protein